jgi:hypothetical protein
MPSLERQDQQGEGVPRELTFVLVLTVLIGDVISEAIKRYLGFVKLHFNYRCKVSLVVL